jgi:peroxiredoxin
MSKKYNFPIFETLELRTELQYPDQRYETLKPVKAGDIISTLASHEGFKQQSSYLNNSTSQQNILAAPHLSKIQVVYFYSRHWGQAAASHLKQLHTIRHEVKYHDANLLVIDADGTDSVLKHTLWLNNLQLPVYTDSNHEIASLLNVYSNNSPAWNRYSGLDVNVPLPSVFVLNHYLEVVFDFINKEIASDLPLQGITNTVYEANNYLAAKKTA